jgi:hypothetical protein
MQKKKVIVAEVGDVPEEEIQIVPVQVEEGKERAERLRSLGLHTAAKVVEQKLEEKKFVRDMSFRLKLAYEHFRVLKPENISAFNEALREKTQKRTGRGGVIYDTLVFVPLEQYKQVPPDNVLDALQGAKDKNLFDHFEVGCLESVEVRPDPLLIGRIKGSEDRFFIAQWDDDVRIEDILKENEG